MDCSEIFELLPLYLEDMLDFSDKALVDEHLKTCDSCRGELEFLKKIQTEMINLPQIEPSKSFKEGLSKRLKEEKRKKTAFYMSGGFKKAVSIAMSAAVIAICITALDTEPYKNNEEILIGKEQISLSDGMEDNVLEETEKEEITPEINVKKASETALADTSGKVKTEIQKDAGKIVETDRATPEKNEPIAENSFPSAATAEEESVAVYDAEQDAEKKAEIQNAQAVAKVEEETTMPKARISSGGGGGSSAAGATEKQSFIKKTLRISFADEDTSYLEILKDFDIENGTYKIPFAEFDTVTNELVAIPDCNATFENEDYSEEYEKLSRSGENTDMLKEIEDITNYGYIIIE